MKKTLLVLKAITVLAVLFCIFLTAFACGEDNASEQDTPEEVIFKVVFVLDNEITVNVKSGEKIEAKDIPATDKEGYEFKGWKNGSVYFDLNTAVTSDLRLVADYESKSPDAPLTITCSVVFVTETETTVKVKSGEKIEIKDIPATDKEGYEFKGWKNGSVYFDLNTAVTSDLRLVADYEEVVSEPTISLTKLNGAELNLYNEYVNAYLSKTTEAETAEYLYRYSKTHQGQDSTKPSSYYCAPGSSPVDLAWDANGENVRVIIASDENFNDVECSFETNESAIAVYNLIPGLHYYKVVGEDGLESETDSFVITGVTRMINTGSRDYNMRDEGGYVGDFGKIKYGLLYRSADITKETTIYKNVKPEGTDGITDEAVEVFVNQLGIKTEVDLRLDVPNRTSPHSSITRYNLGISQFAYILPGCHEGDNVPEGGRERKYSVGTAKNIKEILYLMEDAENYPIVYHCSWGADRTGTLSFIIGAMLGLDYDTLVKDFELTSFSQGRRWRSSIPSSDAEAGIYAFGSSGVMQDNDNNFVAFDEMYRFIMTEYATSDGKLSSAVAKYLIEVVGVTENDIEKVKSVLIEGYNAELPDCTVKFDVQGGNEMSDVIVEYGSKIQIVAPTHSNASERFAYWIMDGSPIDTDNFVVREDITLTARWITSIKTVADFLAINDNLSAYYELENDLDFKDVTVSAIGSAENPFTGILDGKGHRVYGIELSVGSGLSGKYGQGSVFVKNTGTIKNLYVEFTPPKTVNSRVGFVGMNYGSIENCCVKMILSNNINSTDPKSGVVAGMTNSPIIKNCISIIDRGDFNATQNIGGVVGYNYQSALSVVNCYAITNGTTLSYGTNGDNVVYLHNASGHKTTAVKNCGVYSDYNEFVAGVSQLSSENGWSEYWSLSEGVLKFGDYTVISAA